MRPRTTLALPLLASLASCSGGALDPSGAGARRIADIWWVMFWVGLVPLAIVLVILTLTATRRQPGGLLTDRRIIVYGGVVLSSLLLVPVVAVTMLVERDLRDGSDGSMTIEVVGHQFWWDVYHPDPTGEGTVRSANEIHIPVGEPVVLRVTSNDVIHSLWIPEIHGKIDLIPGHTNELTVEADEAGVFRGQCAEFCGIGHAMMRLIVVASPPDEFDQWLFEQSQPADVTISSGTRQLFGNSCAPCHTVRGMFEIPQTFDGDFGPDLTHFASRRMIGANILPNTPQALARWIIDPQGVKPGNRMPDVGLSPDELEDIIALLNELE